MASCHAHHNQHPGLQGAPWDVECGMLSINTAQVQGMHGQLPRKPQPSAQACRKQDAQHVLPVCAARSAP